MRESLQLSQVTWQQAEADLRAIREQVFIHEQGVPIALEWDGLDDDAVHLLGRIDEQVVACARLLSNQHLGRMAVLPEWRRKGIGTQLLQFALQQARELGWASVHISAQQHALEFYQKQGFVITSSVYLDAGIAHCDMVLRLT